MLSTASLAQRMHLLSAAWYSSAASGTSIFTKASVNAVSMYPPCTALLWPAVVIEVMEIGGLAIGSLRVRDIPEQNEVKDHGVDQMLTR